MAGLGRGLDALLSDSNRARSMRKGSSAAEGKASPMPKFSEQSSENPPLTAEPGLVVKISIDNLIASKYQPRINFEEDPLVELSASIKEHGLLEPLLVTQNNDGRYEIICGERRLRACKMAGVKEVPCIIRDVLPKDAYAIALIENVQRQDLNPMEQAQAYDQMMRECGMTQEELAKTLGKSRSSIANFVRLNNLDEEVKDLLAAGRIDMGHAKVILSIGRKDLQAKTARVVIEKGLNVRQTELFVKELNEDGDSQDNQKPQKPEKPKSFSVFESYLSQSLKGAKAKFVVTGQDKGKLTLSYSSQEQLESIMQALGLQGIEDAQEPDPRQNKGDESPAQDKSNESPEALANAQNKQEQEQEA